MANEIRHAVLDNRKIWVDRTHNEVLKSFKYKKLIDIRTQVKKLEDLESKLKDDIEKGTSKCIVRVYSNSLNVSARELKIAPKELMHKIIYANQVKGIPSENMVDHFVKQFDKGIIS